MPITQNEAKAIARRHLEEMEAEINSYGSTLPGHADKKPTELVMAIGEEVDDGWIFAYNSKAFVQDGETGAMLAGNYPFLITRTDGAIHSTAEAEYRHYLDELKERRRANPKDSF